MTSQELAAAVADVVQDHVTLTVAPVLERLAAAEALLKTLGDLRDSVVQLETKAAIPLPPLPTIPDLAPVLGRLATLEAQLAAVDRRVTDDSLTKELGTLRERVAVMEVTGQMPGPPGKDGEPGKDGKDGKDGAAGLSFEGVYQEGKQYEPGQLATWAGSSWHCNEPTTTKPGDGSKAWTLMVKRGRDGKDGAPGAEGKAGRDLTKSGIQESPSWRS